MYKVIDFLLAVFDLLNAVAIFAILVIIAIMLPSFLDVVTDFLVIITSPQVL